jgi:hypothetical protein
MRPARIAAASEANRRNGLRRMPTQRAAQFILRGIEAPGCQPHLKTYCDAELRNDRAGGR